MSDIGLSFEVGQGITSYEKAALKKIKPSKKQNATKTYEKIL
jgi:hypothetical protein